ncbi:DNA repair protein RecN [Corynebacterium breve]|uniref:DNA repair protein RecN n=1 Tax=Corynebacterium breve TaxID=3049799 RepID=A0ABY8VII5_9CORY|nr:DNA repair protein RecN [Corynebacterium breve]WIM68781.1 DNA repair protein RecN [Corynebacterium breve]
MLQEIAITNLGVIPHASAELSEGLTVLTGETGAGKTMVVTGLRLLTGGRADASRVRTGADQAVVEGSFSTEALAAEAKLLVDDIVDTTGGQADENGEYLVSRSVKSTGRSRAHLAGRSVPAATLADFSQLLLTIHGQNDQLRLLAPEEQLAALDRFDTSIAPKREAYRGAWKTWRSLAKDLKERTEKRRELAQEVDRLQFALEEIDAVAPEAGEDEQLLTGIRRLQDVDALREAAETALVAIDGGEDYGSYDSNDAASTLVGQAESALSTSSDEELQALGTQLSQATNILSEVAAELGSYLADLPSDPAALDQMLQRQQDLKSLTKKYAPDAAGVVAWRAKAEKRLAKIDTSAEALEELKKQVAEAEKVVISKANALSKARGAAASRLSEAVTEELRGLAMPKARLSVVVDKQNFGPEGQDLIEMRLAPNDTMDAKPLASSASGGELSRVMLALEVVLSATTAGTTLVFDEVDAGVGGRAAVEIGRRLARLATNNQVIVVTHLPQVAAYADTHLHVSKNVGDDSVTSGVTALTPNQRVEELARMLAGLDDTETGRAHAQELMQRAQDEVGKMRG